MMEPVERAFRCVSVSRALMLFLCSGMAIGGLISHLIKVCGFITFRIGGVQVILTWPIHPYCREHTESSCICRIVETIENIITMAEHIHFYDYSLRPEAHVWPPSCLFVHCQNEMPLATFMDLITKYHHFFPSQKGVDGLWSETSVRTIHVTSSSRRMF